MVEKVFHLEEEMATQDQEREEEKVVHQVEDMVEKEVPQVEH